MIRRLLGRVLAGIAIGGFAGVIPAIISYGPNQTGFRTTIIIFGVMGGVTGGVLGVKRKAAPPDERGRGHRSERGRGRDE